VSFVVPEPAGVESNTSRGVKESSSEEKQKKYCQSPGPDSYRIPFSVPGVEQCHGSTIASASTLADTLSPGIDIPADSIS